MVFDDWWVLVAIGIGFVLYIAYFIGQLAGDNRFKKRERESEEAHKRILERRKVELAQLEWEYQQACERLAAEQRKKVEELAADAQQNAPWAAEQYADLVHTYDYEVALQLRKKSRPAVKAAAEVAKIAREKHTLQKQCKMLEYQLAFYESAFPWLEEFKTIDAKEAWEYAKGMEGEGESEYEQLKKWLSPEEYQRLPTAEKFQIALDRFRKRKKTSWEVGIEYERFVGYMLEQAGYKVKYQGALLGLEDMGRDLIATKGRKTLVIQCKRWAKEKTIHEKHIFQLYGSVVLLSTQNPNKTYKGVFITTTNLSDVAKQCAEYLGIEVVEEFEFSEYPVIKCNVAHDGEKIYHLPFDQQYDRVEIAGKKGACYVETAQEAENKGFRRAYRWRPNAK